MLIGQITEVTEYRSRHQHDWCKPTLVGKIEPVVSYDVPCSANRDAILTLRHPRCIVLLTLIVLVK